MQAGDRLAAGMLLVRSSWRVILQATVAATLAYSLARLIGHHEPFFAPIAAVATVAISLGNRLRRSTELVIGNALGILMADVLIARIGTGSWQVGLVVAIALVGALLLGGGPILIMQSSSAAILIATISPPTAEQRWNTGRFSDALIGGVIGLLVSGLLLPVDPGRHTRNATEPLLGALADGLRRVAAALRAHDAAQANAALTDLRATGRELEGFKAALDATRESVRIAPWYWGQRTILVTYALAGIHLDNAIRNCRVLARQAAVSIDRGEVVSPGVPDAMDRLAEAAVLIGPVLTGESPEPPRDAALSAVVAATTGPLGSGLFTAPMVAQVRLIASDLLQATDLGTADAAALIRSLEPSPKGE